MLSGMAGASADLNSGEDRSSDSSTRPGAKTSDCATGHAQARQKAMEPPAFPGRFNVPRAGSCARG